MAGRSPEKLETAKTKLETELGGRAQLSTLQIDIVDETSGKNASAQGEQQFGRLDVLVNNAGVTSNDPDIRTRCQKCMETNALGSALVAAAFRPLLLRSKNPYSIWITSGVGSLSAAAGPNNLAAKFPNGEFYRASKAALNVVMLDEWAIYNTKGLKTFGVDPGLVVSNLRGSSDHARSAGGRAGDPAESGEVVLRIIQGKNDQDVGKVIDKDGIVAW